MPADVVCQYCEMRKVPKQICQCTEVRKLNVRRMESITGRPLYVDPQVDCKFGTVSKTDVTDVADWDEIAENLRQFSAGELSVSEVKELAQRVRGR